MTNFSIEGNPNYAALVVEFDPNNVVVLPNRDRVVGYKVAGYQSIIQKDVYTPGQVLIVFGAETQVSEDYAYHNNLHRHSDRNVDPNVVGYLEDNRRVKAIKFAGHQSDALVMPISSLGYLNSVLWAQDLVGYSLDTIDGKEICRKYIVKVKGDGRSMGTKQGQKKVRVTTESFPEHPDTANLFRNLDAFRPDEYVTVTQKVHGTSVRLGRVPVLRDLKWYERLAQKVGVKVQTHEYGVVVGSRRVTKSIDGEVETGKDHYYAEDIWTEATRDMHALIPENFLVYAEIVGWTPEGTEIQKNYTYEAPFKTSKVYVYRVATVNGQGDVVDLPWRAVERFCEARGWSAVPMLWAGLYKDFNPEAWLDTRFNDTELIPQAVRLSHPTLPDEGVVVRSESGFQPTVLKAKSPKFLQHESVVLSENEQTGTVDTESAEDVG